LTQAKANLNQVMPKVELSQLGWRSSQDDPYQSTSCVSPRWRSRPCARSNIVN